MRNRLIVFSVAALLLTLGSIGAQPFGTDMLVIERTGGVLLRVPAGVPATTIGSGYGAPGSVNSIAMDVGNTHVIAAVDSTASGGHLERIDVVSGVATTVVKGLGRIWITKVDQNGDYLAATFLNPSSLMRVKRDGSSVTTVGTYTYAPIFEQDISSGDWLLAHASGQVLRYSNDFSTIKNTIAHGAFWSYTMESDPHLSRIYLAAADLLSIDTGSDTVTTLDLTGPGGGLAGRALEVDRAPDSAGGIIYAGTNLGSNSSALWRFDRAGTVLGTYYSSASSYVLTAAFDQSQNLGALQVSPPNNRVLAVSFPGELGKQYVVAFSLTGPGPGVTLADGRVIPITPDNLTFLTAQQALPPLVVNNLGTLDAAGGASVQLNLNILGAAVNGVRLWAVALIIDPRAPLGIGQISRPFLLVL